MDTDVVVVGAGAAGLAAGLWLAERSVRVIVVEARDKIGGRVMWQPVGSVDVPAELGAEFIHGAAPETSEFLRAAALEKVDTAGDSWVCEAGGGLRRADDEFGADDIFGRVSSLAQDESVQTFLGRFENDPATRDIARRARLFVEGFEAADPALASARAIADELRSGVDSTASRPIGSYAPLFEYLNARCASAGADIRLNTTVSRIAWQSGDAKTYGFGGVIPGGVGDVTTGGVAGVALEVQTKEAGTSTIHARCVVVTVPLGVLQQRSGATPLSFVPPLPEEKQNALRGLEMGHAARVTLAFRRPFWEELAGGRYRDAAFFRCEGGAFNAFWAQMPLRSRTIVAWAGGPRATALAGTSAEERIERALDEFGALLDARDLARREYEGGVTHDWSADPYACGAYSYVTTGGGNARATLAQPVGDTLFFAGEATATEGQGGTVSGAFGSGTRAAAEAAHALEAAVALETTRALETAEAQSRVAQ